MSKKRIVFYSHDTFGLGHIRRTQKIANQLASDDMAILVLCSSPKAADYRTQEGIEYLNLPGFTKLETGDYIPRNLNVELEDFVRLRSEIIFSALKAFKPDVFIVDKEPLGVKKELLPTLQYLKKNTNCHTICGLRDILDTPEKIAQEWGNRGSEQAFTDYYKSVIVYGDQKIYNLTEEYNIPKSLIPKFKYMGYIFQERSAEADDKQMFNFNNHEVNELPLVTFSLGGGEDGEDFLRVYTKLLKSKQHLPFKTIIVTGPFIRDQFYQNLLQEFEDFEQVKIVDFIPNMFDLIKRSDALVTMGGYNTLTEALSLGQTPLVLPRVAPRQEQLLRATIFKERGLCDYIHPDELNEDILYYKIINQLEMNLNSGNYFELNGLENTTCYIKSILHEKENSIYSEGLPSSF